MTSNVLKKQLSLWGALLTLVVASAAFAASDVESQAIARGFRHG